MARAILQCHQVRIRSDQAFIRFQRIDRKHRFYENEDHVHFPQIRGICHANGAKELVLACALTNGNAIRVDIIDSVLIDIDQPYVIVFGQVSSEQHAHCSCA